MAAEPTTLGATEPPDSPPRPSFFHGWCVMGAAFIAAFGSVVFYNPAVLGVFSTSLEAEFG